MGDVLVILGQPDVDSIVLGAAENAAQRLGFTISPSAKDLLLQRSLPSLDRENQQGKLESRRQELQASTAALIQHIVTEEIGSSGATQITYQHMLQGLSAFCKKFPDFAPFCTR
jgi:hypothetical protein